MIRGELSLSRVRITRVSHHEGCFRRHFLHPAEEQHAARLAVDKRRIDYVAGRTAAKRAVRRLGLSAGPTEIAVLPDEGYRSGAPVVFDRAGRRRPEPISISHGSGFAYAAAAPRGRLGVDVERIEPRFEGFTEEAFAPGEVDRWAAALGRARGNDSIITIAWCAKEALLKLAGIGLRAPLWSHAIQSIRWHSAAPSPEASRLDVTALAWAEVETLELGTTTLGVATRRDMALVIAWDEGPSQSEG